VRCWLYRSTLRDSHDRTALGACRPRDSGLDHIAICFIKKHVVPNVETGLPTNLNKAELAERLPKLAISTFESGQSRHWDREAIVQANHAERREQVSSTESNEVRFHGLGLEEGSISFLMSPSPAMRSSSQTNLFVEKDAALDRQQRPEWQTPGATAMPRFRIPYCHQWVPGNFDWSPAHICRPIGRKGDFQ
jgi:hypothetical protein